MKYGLVFGALFGLGTTCFSPWSEAKTRQAEAGAFDQEAALAELALPEPSPEGPPTPTATTHHAFEWRWSRFGLVDYVATTVIAGTYFFVEFGTKSPRDPRWTGPILFDAAARSGFVAEGRAGRNRAGTISDYFMLAPPIIAVVDSLAVPLLFDDWNWDVAWQMTAINTQAIAVSGLITRLGGHRLVARERPDGEPCRQDVNYDDKCFRGPNASFPSGHTSASFVGAGLACAHHLKLRLYGGAPDIAFCAVMTAAATTSGVLRLVADRHYASDVISGAFIGAGAGFALPMLVHYRSPSRSAEPAHVARWTVTPLSEPSSLGLTLYGWF